MKAIDPKTMTKVPVATADDLIKAVRLMAMTGRRVFTRFLFDPLDYANWKRRATNEQSKKLMQRIEAAVHDSGAQHTVGPFARRMISASMHESFSALGDASIFFLEKMQQFVFVATLAESLDFVRVLYQPARQFLEQQQNQNAELFASSLDSLSAIDFKAAFQPIDLGKHKIKIEIQRQAMDLFHKIKIANANDDPERCRKLIGAYLIKYGDQENNNRNEVESLIEAFQKKDPQFRSNLESNIAVNLYYTIQTSIAQGNIQQTIAGIRKYAHIFQGNPSIQYFYEIDGLEKKLYDIITARDLWQELKG
ncbi:MAG: hypothetical protein KDK39_04920 [Leptospiraceae bacterium]|nr:hypothetical protein [Leptospiraceae bacterium]